MKETAAVHGLNYVTSELRKNARKACSQSLAEGGEEFGGNVNVPPGVGGEVQARCGEAAQELRAGEWLEKAQLPIQQRVQGERKN
jgi:hypothetical protein